MAARRSTHGLRRRPPRGGSLVAFVAMLACLLYAALPIVQSAHSHAAHGPVPDASATVHACSHAGHHSHEPTGPADEPRPVHDHDDCRICLALKMTRMSGTPGFSAAGLIGLLPASIGRALPIDALPAPAPSLTSAPARGPPTV